MVWDRKCSQSEDKWESCMALLDNGAQVKHHHAKVCEQTLPSSGTNY